MNTYENILPFLEEIMEGRENVLTNEPVHYLQLTSGTASGQQKLIPGTSSYRRGIWRAVLASQGFLNQWIASRQDITKGKGLMFMYTAPLGVVGSKKLPYGTVTTYHSEKTNLLWKTFSATPFEITRVSDIESLEYLTWLYGLTYQGDISFMSATYGVSLLNSADLLFKESARLIEDIAKGTISSLGISDREKRVIGYTLKPNIGLARKLEKIAKKDGGLLPKAVWPDLGWIFTVYGATFRHYETLLQEWYSPKFIWGLPYLASEGIVGIPYTANSYYHLPVVGETFLEFIPEGEWDKPFPETCLLRDVAVGERYEVVITSRNGLYRYKLGDIVQIGETYLGVPTLKVISRRESLISIVWEKTTEAQLIEAVECACKQYNIHCSNFFVAADRKVVPPRYRVQVEIEDRFGRNSSIAEALASYFDACLSKINLGYGRLRAQREIGYPTVELLPVGTFKKVYNEEMKKKAHPNQVKILHVRQE